MRRCALLVLALALGLAAPARADLPVPSSPVDADTTLPGAGGDSTTLVAGGGADTYVRFRVGGLPIPPQRSVLRLYVTDSSAQPTTVDATLADWDEHTTTAPRVVSGTLASLPSVTAGHWAEYDVTRLVAAAGEISVAVHGSSSDPASFASRESAHPPQLQITTKDTTQELAWRLSRPKNADAVRYQATDDAGGTLDGLKIVPDPVDGGYLGVWHADEDGRFVSRVGTSTDLLHWQRRADLGDHDGQPTLALLPGGGALVVSEADEPGGPHLRFRRYPSVAALLAAAPDATFDAPRTLAPTAEGTPSIHSVDAGAQHVSIGFHYFRDVDVDRQATGLLLGFRDWSAQPDARRNALYEGLGVAGNLGDRDELTFRGRRYTVQEGQTVKHDFGSWHEYLEDQQTGLAAQLPMATAGSSASFGNGTATVLLAPDGRLAIAATDFVFAPRSGRGEAGEMIFVSEFDDAPPPGTVPDPGVAPDTSPLPGDAPQQQPATTVPQPTPQPQRRRAAPLRVLRLAPVSRRALRRPGTRYRVRVAAPRATVHARLSTAAGRTIATTTRRLDHAQTTTLTLRPGPRGHRTLARARGHLVLTLRIALPDGTSASARRSVALRR